MKKMVSRRGFLGVLMGLAAAPVLARLPMIEMTSAIPVVESPLVLPHLTGHGYLMSLTTGCQGGEKAASYLRLLRHNQNQLMIFNIGSYFYYKAALGQEIMFTPEFPLIFDVSGNIDIKLVYRNESGEFRARNILANGTVTDVSMYP